MKASFNACFEVLLLKLPSSIRDCSYNLLFHYQSSPSQSFLSFTATLPEVLPPSPQTFFLYSFFLSPQTNTSFSYNNFSPPSPQPSFEIFPSQKLSTKTSLLYPTLPSSTAFFLAPQTSYFLPFLTTKSSQ